MNTIRSTLLAIGAAILLSACGSNAHMAKEMDSLASEKLLAQKIAVESVHASAADVPDHFLSAVSGHLKNELRKRGLLADETISDAGQIDVDVTYYRMRSGFSRMMFGVLAGKDGIEGQVVIKDAKSGTAISKMDVSSYNIMAVGNEDDIARMFAEDVAGTIEKNLASAKKNEKVAQH